jgi:hypothetical protein
MILPVKKAPFPGLFFIRRVKPEAFDLKYLPAAHDIVSCFCAAGDL